MRRYTYRGSRRDRMRAFKRAKVRKYYRRIGARLPKRRR